MLIQGGVPHIGNLGGVTDSCLILLMMGSSLSTIAGGDFSGEVDFPDLVMGIVVIWFLWFKIGGKISMVKNKKNTQEKNKIKIKIKQKESKNK